MTTETTPAPIPTATMRAVPQQVSRHTATALQAVAEHLADAAPTDLLTATRAWQRGMAQLASMTTTPGIDTAALVHAGAQALLAGEDVPANAADDLLAARRRIAAAEEHRNVVVAATDQVGTLARHLLAEHAEDLLTGPVSSHHDALMVQVRAVVGEHGQALTADDLLRTNGAAGDRARAAVARLHALHAELETVRRVHLALFAYLTAGRDREVVPGTAATMTALARARVLWCPGFATAWPAWRRPLVPPGTPEPASPWQGGPVQQLLTLVAHGSWTPTPQQVATAWLDALDAQDGAPAA